jgi:uncharacterized protein
MRKLALFTFLLLLGAQCVYAIDFPKPTGFVSDFANILPAETKSSLEAVLQEFEKQTSNEITVVTVTSLEGMDEFPYAQALFTAWGIGKSNRNNGILFLIAPNERRYFINVGKGLEGALTDSMAGSILRAEVSPNFKNGDFATGITNGVTAIMAATKGEYIADTSSSSFSSDFDPVSLIWIGFIVLTWLAAFLGRSESWWLGGVIGGVISLVLSLFLFAGLAILFTTIFGTGAGLLFDYIISKNYALRRKQGKPTDFWHSGGGFWFGGGRHGGFGGGGGFGGFGGGGSGGGGAGGGW